jgi:TerC family integral membrane protein
MATLFPLGEYWWLYGVFVGVVVAVLALDLGLFRRGDRAMSFREALGWSATWVGVALLFNGVLYAHTTWRLAGDPRYAAFGTPEDVALQVALEFFTGYLVEYSLSIDNIFVFVLVFRYFSVPARYQHHVLFYGILGALVFRAVFIGLGSVLMQLHWVVWLFGLFLIFTAVKIAVSAGESAAPDRNVLVRMVRRVVPLTSVFHGSRFFVREGGRLRGTPLFVALLSLEATDIVFAIDSVPAIFAITREPFIVFTSNVCAILGLRSMYFMLGGAIERFHLLRYGLALVLLFVGLKMVWLDAWFGGKFPIGPSLAIIGAALALSIVASLLLPPKGESHHPGPRRVSASRREAVDEREGAA